MSRPAPRGRTSHHLRVGLVALLLLTAAPGVAQQEDRVGAARANGLVRTLGDDPITNARVWLRRPGSPDDGPETVTDGQGRWVLMGVAGGRWEIHVRAEGFIDAQGWIEIEETTPNFPVKIRLRPLTEVSPAFSGGDPQSIRAWIDKGNMLLEERRYSEARIEYEKALSEMPEAARPEVLRAVARTWFMEGDLGATLRSLRQALYWDPTDEDTRSLYAGVLAEVDRDEEGRELLAALDREGRDAFDVTKIFDEEDQPRFARLPPEIANMPVLLPEPGRTGGYRVRFEKHNPWSDVDDVVARLGMTRKELGQADPAKGRYDLADESFRVFVPEAESGPDGESEPWGLFVWISPTPFGGFSSDDMRQMLEKHRLIWVGADNSGNSRMKWYRYALALDAVANMRELYDIDERRVYASGYSGGGRVTSGLTMLWPEVFAGGFSVYGCDYFQRVELPDKPGAYWPARLPEPDRDVVRRLKEEKRFVLLTGELDFNRAQTLAIWEKMDADGFRGVTYLDVPGASHYTRVPLEWLDKAVRALDGDTGAGIDD